MEISIYVTFYASFYKYFSLPTFIFSFCFLHFNGIFIDVLVFVYFFLLSAASILHKIHLRRQRRVCLDTFMMAAMNLQCGCICFEWFICCRNVFTSWVFLFWVTLIAEERRWLWPQLTHDRHTKDLMEMEQEQGSTTYSIHIGPLDIYSVHI